LRSIYVLYKTNCKWNCNFLPHGDKSTHKLWIPMQQVELNVQSLIDMCVDTMPHQMKRIGNGRQDVWCLLLDTWKNLWEQSDEIRYSEKMGNILIFC
jgi:hypothetical protein